MRAALLAAAAAVTVLPAAIAGTAPAHADAPSPPYVDRTEWFHWADLSSLRVYPTLAGREASTDLVSPDEAWAEVLVDAPDADLPGMREQFVCHWDLAEAVEPGKTSWNLEPWRPAFDLPHMIDAGCNPGGIEDPS